MTTITVGKKAPDFTVPLDTGETFTLSRQKGHPVAVFFYPEVDTEGCATENREFSALMPEFAALGAKVIGISPDSSDKHRRFRERNGIGILMGSDPDRKVITSYGAWGPKKMFGRPYDGVIRTSLLVDADGKVAEIFKVTRIKGHAANVLASLKARVGSIG